MRVLIGAVIALIMVLLMPVMSSTHIAKASSCSSSSSSSKGASGSQLLGWQLRLVVVQLQRHVFNIESQTLLYRASRPLRAVQPPTGVAVAPAAAVIVL